MKKSIFAFVLVGSLIFGFGVTQAKAKTLRAEEMTTQQWSQLTASGPQNTVVEFRLGDEIPVSLTTEGDLLETVQTGVTYVKVKKSFWLRLAQNSVEISLDGTNFKSLHDVLTGSFEAGAVPNENGLPVNAINLLLKAYLK